MIVSKEIIALEDVKKDLLEFCVEPHNQQTILTHIQVPISSENYKRYVGTLVKQRFIKSEQDRNRNSINQNYIITQKGLNYLKAIS